MHAGAPNFHGISGGVESGIPGFNMIENADVDGDLYFCLYFPKWAFIL